MAIAILAMLKNSVWLIDWLILEHVSWALAAVQWNVFVCSPYVTDSSIAITVCVVLFMLPSQAPNYLCFKTCNKGKDWK